MAETQHGRQTEVAAATAAAAGAVGAAAAAEFIFNYSNIITVRTKKSTSHITGSVAKQSLEDPANDLSFHSSYFAVVAVSICDITPDPVPPRAIPGPISAVRVFQVNRASSSNVYCSLASQVSIYCDYIKILRSHDDGKKQMPWTCFTYKYSTVRYVYGKFRKYLNPDILLAFQLFRYDEQNPNIIYILNISPTNLTFNYK
uniref:Uncharacterized protein n=1 Tax=Glossina austeni TaxID=7395 RepID=A0A1A9V353_GLOAU